MTIYQSSTAVFIASTFEAVSESTGPRLNPLLFMTLSFFFLLVKCPDIMYVVVYIHGVCLLKSKAVVVELILFFSFFLS